MMMDAPCPPNKKSKDQRYAALFHKRLSFSMTHPVSMQFFPSHTSWSQAMIKSGNAFTQSLDVLIPTPHGSWRGRGRAS